MTRQRAGVGLAVLIAVLLGAALLRTGAGVAQPTPVQLPPVEQGPVQPIAFSHRIHAGVNQMNCLYCHYTADRSQWANIPAVDVCMGCHRITAAQRPEVQKLQQYWNERRPIPWVRVYFLPRHARFNHKRHVKAGFDCQVCHGPVKDMDLVYQWAPLTMNWCITCHDGRNDLKKKASVDCLTCHY